MDREAQMSRRRAVIIIIGLAVVFLVAVIGLVIVGIRNGKLASGKVLRSEFAEMLNNRETMNCTISWKPSEKEREEGLGDTANPLELTMTFAMEKGGEKFYLDRYELYGTYASIYSNGEDVYMWSAVPLLAERGQLYDGDFVAHRFGNVRMTRDQFEKAFPDFLSEIDDFVKNVEAGAEIQCGTGGVSSYSEPKDVKDWKQTNE